MARVNQSLVANRLAIAIRIIRACRELGIPTATFYTEQNAPVLHVVKADQAISVSPGPESLTLAPSKIIPEGDDYARAFPDAAPRMVSGQPERLYQ
jgi:acetyl/propionyl-CoA carboxylase alpha subunit